MNKGWPNESQRHALSSKGIKTSFDPKKQIIDMPINKRILHSHSYRNYRPEEFLEYSIEDNKINMEKYNKAKEILYKMESTRLQSLLFDASRFFASLDKDEQDTWAKNNPELMKWVGIYGFLYEYNTYKEYTGVPSRFDFELMEAKGSKNDIQTIKNNLTSIHELREPNQTTTINNKNVKLIF